MAKKQVTGLTIAGIGLLIIGIVVTTQTSLPDTVKGLFIGIAIGILALPVIFKLQGKLKEQKN